MTEKAGIKVDGWSISSTWLDYDKDGCVDLFVGRYVKFDPKYRAFYAADNYPGPLDYEGETNKLFHNNCDGTFTDVTDKSGIGAYVGRTMGVTAADFDGDGWDDIYVANDRTENFLFHNKHDGTFEEIANETGTAFGQNGESTSVDGAGVCRSGRQGHAGPVGDRRALQPDAAATRASMSFDDMGATNGVSQANAQYVSWGIGRLRLRQRRPTGHSDLSRRIDSPDSAGAHAVSRARQRAVRRCFAAGGPGVEQAHGGARRLLCRLRQ